MHKHQPYQADQQRLFLRSCLNTLSSTIIIRPHLWHKHFAEIVSLQKKKNLLNCNTLACDAAVISDICFMGFTRAGVKSVVFLCNQSVFIFADLWFTAIDVDFMSLCAWKQIICIYFTIIWSWSVLFCAHSSSCLLVFHLDCMLHDFLALSA